MPNIPAFWDDPNPEVHWDNPNLFWDTGLVEEAPGAHKPMQIVLDLRSLDEPGLTAKGTTIATNFANAANAALVTGSPYTGAQLQVLVTAFANKRQAGIDFKQAQKTNTSEKAAAKTALESALTLVKSFTEAKPTLTPAQALALGFDLKAAPTPPAIVAPEDFSVTFGDVAGSVSCHWQPVTGARLYLVQARLANTPGAAWVTGYNNSASDCRLIGLTPGALYELQVCAVFPGVDQPGPACSVVEHRAA